jgi:hypothetical protein
MKPLEYGWSTRAISCFFEACSYSGPERLFDQFRRHCTRPPSPPILGGKTLVLGYLPPKLGGRGGECKDE